MEVMVIGYGSLMSGVGLSSSGQFQLRSACIVALAPCARGFAKLSRHGLSLAGDLEVAPPPLEGHMMSPTSVVGTPVEAMGLTVSLEELARLVKREGYQPDALRKVVQEAHAQGLGLAEFLWNLDTAGSHDLVAYRRQLLALTDYTSPHYIPHPVRLVDVGFALVFLAPGYEGTGSDDVVSVRQRTGMRALLPTATAWQERPNDRQLSYFLSCLLGGAHGISVHDLLASIPNDPELATMLRQRLREMLPDECERFLSTTRLSQADYQQAFGASPEAALRRSGLQAFLDQATPEPPMA